MATAADVKRSLLLHADPVRARNLLRFFKTGKGEYGEGDLFLGITLPVQRAIVKEFKDLAFPEMDLLIQSPYHEHRLAALLILTQRFPKAVPVEKKRIYDFYLKNTRYINNWDLVDLSAPIIVGGYLIDKSRKEIYRLARSSLLWERRIAMVATLSFIRKGDFEDALKIAELLLGDRHDLIHKATGWMLREIGKRDEALLENFLRRNATTMPRTALRYAIERLPERKYQEYLSMKRS